MNAAGRIAALARRDATTQISYQFNLLLRFGQMFFWLLSLYFIAKLVRQPPELARYGGDYFGFALIGVIITAVTALGLGGFGTTINDEQRTGTLELLLATPTSMATLLTGSLVVPLALTAVEIVVYLTAGWAVFGLELTPGRVLTALPALALTAVVLAAFGVLSASFVVLTKRGDPFTLLLTQATTFVAGAIFPVEVLPGPVQALAHAVPAFYSLDALRRVLLTGASLGDVGGDLLALACFGAALLPLSLWAFGRSLAVARRTGTLGNF